MAEASPSSLHDAARAGDLETIRTLLASNPGATNTRDRHSRTPYPLKNSKSLHMAAWSGKAEAVKVLCEYKADINASAMDDMSAFHFACQKGHIQVVKELLSAGASIGLRTRKGLTPLHYAVQGNHKDLALYLVRRGSNLTVKNKAGKTALELAKDEEFRKALEGESLAIKARKEAKAAERAQARLEAQKQHEQNQDKADQEDVEAAEGDGVKCEGEEPTKKKARVVLSHLENAEEEGDN